jgi:hypothetical protein
MLTASKNIMQEEWVQRWLAKLTPKQKELVIEVLEDFNKHRKPTEAAVFQAEAVVRNSHPTAASRFTTTHLNLPHLERSAS